MISAFLPETKHKEKKSKAKTKQATIASKGYGKNTSATGTTGGNKTTSQPKWPEEKTSLHR
jgi:hypothetical protein